MRVHPEISVRYSEPLPLLRGEADAYEEGGESLSIFLKGKWSSK